MREPESFDAFYARTVANVTSSMHGLAGGDSQADHAIREAYARAYQQWYEVSGYRDPEAWVLDAAKDAFARRQAQVGTAGPAAEQRPDSGTWPGIYRERPPRGTGDPEATVAPGSVAPGGPAGAPGGQPATAAAGQQPAAGPDSFFPDSYQGGSYQPAGPLAAPYSPDPYGPDPHGTAAADPFAAAAGPGVLPYPPDAGRDRPGATGAGPGPKSGPSRALLAILGVVALAAVSVAAYFAFGQGKNSPTAGPATGPGGTGPPPVQMLAAGKVGPRSAVPWSLVGTGWALAEFSPGQPGSGGGPVTTYLVDPQGGRYTIANWPGNTATALIAWSGDKKTALFSTGSGSTASYSLLALHTGAATPLSLPAGVAVAGFTRPDGLNLLAVQQGPARYRLERFNLDGSYAATLSTMARRPSQPAWTDTCAGGCGAISSPDGVTAVWGIAGDEMQLASNSGGLIRKLHVPQSGSPPSCTPISWWDTKTVLASCAAAGQAGASRLWQVPVDGSTPTPLTLASGSGSGAGLYTGAWSAGGQVYVTATSSTQCPSAASGPGGLGIFRLASSGSDTTISVPGSTSYHNAIVGSVDGRLLVLAQTSCPGTSALEWFNPATRSSQQLLPAAAGQAGVVAAVAYNAG
jgi:hypothetical protein